MSGELTDRARLHKKANEALEQNLVPGETVEVIITGPSNQAIIGTNRRAFVYKKGFMAGASFGSELTTWDYCNLVGVQLHTGMMTGAVVLQAPGLAGTSTSTWNNKDSDPYKTPNAIPIVRPWDQAQAGVARLRQLVDAAHRPEAPAVPPPPPDGLDLPRDDSSNPAEAPSAPQSGGPTVQLLRDLAELHARWHSDQRGVRDQEGRGAQAPVAAVLPGHPPAGGDQTHLIEVLRSALWRWPRLR